MKKLFFFLFSIIFTLTIVGCANDESNQETKSNVFDTNKSFAFSTYIASGILSAREPTTELNSQLTSNIVLFLTDDPTKTEEFEIETEIDDVNLYFNKLKVFMDSDVNEVLNITEQESTLEDYEYELTYSIEDVTYTIYYSLEVTEEVTSEDDDRDELEKEFSLTGLMVIDGVNYELIGGNETSVEEQEMWFKTIEQDDNQNYVNVEISKDQGEQTFELESLINGVEKSSEIKFEEDENETEIELTLVQNDQESYYEFKKEVDDDTIYKFEYQIGDTEGEVEILEKIDEQGNVTYAYEIEEEGQSKEIEKPKLKHEDED